MKTKPVSAPKWRYKRTSSEVYSEWWRDGFVIFRKDLQSGCEVGFSGGVMIFYHDVTPATARAIIDGRRVGNPDRIVSASEALLRLAVAKVNIKEGR